MKRMTLIAVALCLLLLTTVGAGVVVAKKEAKAPQAGKSPVYHFDVTTADPDGSGKLTINTKQQTFVFNGKGFEPGKPYRLSYTEGSTPGGPPAVLHTLASAVANKAGNVHIEGTWTLALDSWPAPAFTINIVVSPGSGPAVYTGLITGDGTEEGWGHYYVFVTSDGTTHRIYQGQTGPDSLPTGSHATFTVEAIRTNADHTVVVASGPVVVTSSDPPGTWSWYADMKPA